MKTIETDRLILRGWRLEDADDFFEYARHPEVGPNGGWPPHGSREESLKVIQYFIDDDDIWAIVLKETGKVIGSVGLHKDSKRVGISVRELGFVVSADYWGQGIATEAAKRAVKYAFEDMELALVSTYHKSFNDRARRVVEKCGFTREGMLRQGSKRYDGLVFDAVCYSILRAEYEG
ncbi:MAG: GNAT family N-acetyltransferase [Defluviitaleaceae bacterium]|nr:GNAT family N-acetyltransferase [Defluviitaleaceae bacterium]